MASFGAVVDAGAAVQANDGFDPNANSIVNAVVLQPDGKILIGGYFTQLRPFGQAVSGDAYIARLNHDGTVDPAFNPNANAVVRALVLQPNGQILMAGQFTTLQSTGGGTPLTRNYAGRLNADGTVDSVFNPNANGVVYALAYQPNGQVVIGGSFTSVQPTGSATPVTRNHIARLNADGTLDTTFDPNTDKPVLSLAVQPNGQILVGGGFSTFQPNGGSSVTPRRCAARLNPDGTVDATFDPEPNSSVNTILILPNGQIIFGGLFTTVQPNGAASTTQVDFLARINQDGTLDENYIVNPLAAVSAVALQQDGKLVIGGNFTQIYPINNLSAESVRYAARINADGSLDASFISNPNQAVNAVAVQPDGNIVLGGYFTAFQPVDSATPIQRNFIARVTTYGIPDASLAPDNAGTVFVSAQLPNGQVLVGGTFLSIGGETQNFLARLNTDGSLDHTFAPVINGPVQAMYLQSDGKVVIGGSFSVVDGFSRSNMARLNADGTLDGPFNPSPNASVTAIAVLSTGQMLIGGNFTELIPDGSPDGFAISYLARINADGTLDANFNPVPDGAVFAIALQSDGRIIIAGGFTTVGGATRPYVARLLSTGAIDTAPFNPEPNLSVYAIAVQSDGKILIGGGFTGVLPLTGVIGTSTTLTTPYGTITVPAAGTNATVPIYINHLARLNKDGTLDTTFFPDPSSDVLSLAVQSNGQILVGGLMTSFDPYSGPSGTVRNYVGRVNADGTLDTSFNPNANALVNTVNLLSNGNVLIGGSFTTVQPNGAAAPTFANHVAILNGDGSLDTAFSSGTNGSVSGQVSAMAQQPNGQFLAAGTFGPFGGSQAAHLARFNPDGSPDASYDAVISGPVNAIDVLPNGATTVTPTNSAAWLNSTGSIRYAFSAASNGEVVSFAQQADGKVLVGGLFSDFAGVSGIQNLVRLNTDGTVDRSFEPPTNGVVSAIAVQADGKILIGGSFTTVYTTTNSYLARLNADGSLDTTFAPQPSAPVNAIVVLSSGQILIGGQFTYLYTGTSTASQVSYLARLNSDGTRDKAFAPDPDNFVYAIAVNSAGKIYIGGAFNIITPNMGSTTYNVQELARLNADGSLDTTFYPDPNAAVTSIALQPNGQILVGGSFTEFEQNATVVKGTPGPVVPVAYLARVNADATVDTTFKPTPNGALTYISLQTNGQILFGGGFSELQPNYTGAAINRDNIARINSDGTVDASFDPEVNGAVNVVVPLADGSIFVGGNFSDIQVGGAYVIGGSFATVGGNAAANLALLNSDGTYDSAFSAHPDGPVNTVVSQTNNELVVGGSFANVDGSPRANVVRLNLDGTLDASFSADTNGAVNSVALQQNGQILMGGAFTTVGGQTEYYLARLGSSGTVDASFSAALNGAVNAVVVQPNGQVVVAGAFTSVGGQAIGGVARLNSNGSLDTSFNPNANGTVQALTLQTDGTFYIGGAFTSVSGQPVAHFAHVLANGAVDPNFTPNPNGTIDAISVQADGKVVAGGNFTSAGGLARYDIARFASATPTSSVISISTDQTVLTWTRTGPAPSLSQVKFEESTDGTHWMTAGEGSTTDGITWQLTGASPTGTSVYFVRATGVAPSSEFGSSGLLQQIYLAQSLGIPVINSISSVTAVAGSPFSFTVTSTQSTKTFYASGLPAGLSINSLTGIISGTPTAAGTYPVTITVGNASGSTSSALTLSVGAPGTVVTPTGADTSDRLINLSCRAHLAGSEVLISGFVISGTTSKTVLLRAVGPALTSFDVAGAMQHPELQLISSSGTLLQTNTAWGGSASLAAVFAQVGAFSLVPTSNDAAIVATLAPGSYTVHVFDPTATGGVVLAEIYDASSSDSDRLVNLSARGFVSEGNGALIGGFVVNGTATKSVLIRGVGPGLAAFGVTDAIPDPVLSVYDQNGNLVAENAVWTTQSARGTYQAAASASNITAADSSVGAFALSSTSADAALIANLPPGAYTFQVTSGGNANGEALGEVYELP